MFSVCSAGLAAAFHLYNATPNWTVRKEIYSSRSTATKCIKITQFNLQQGCVWK